MRHLRVGALSKRVYTANKRRILNLMNGKFIASADVERDELDWGTIGWLSRPESTGGKDIVAMEVSLSPGYGHDFHKHPEQEEVPAHCLRHRERQRRREAHPGRRVLQAGHGAGGHRKDNRGA